VLEQRGFEVLLVNTHDLRNVRGRKSDVQDCEWLRQLNSVGLLRPSFRPAAAMVPLRFFMRQRAILVEETHRPRSAHAEGVNRDEPYAPHRGQRHHRSNRA
jgi:hypothetical protein